ncbi:MAG: BtrH N-terminal domain-containing protein [Defluviitaleaceae bacterium]|nr:BtrH N-terminal domain-containing protein [Defluviitaleaceae bacterium]
MRELIINCNIDKLLRIFPHVSEYVALTNIWDVKIELYEGKDYLNEAEVRYDRTRANFYFREFLKFYSIISKQSTKEIDYFLSENIPVFLQCDNYYLPYHEFYKKVHTTRRHLILIEAKRDDDSYLVYDDIPSYEGYLSKHDIDILHECASYQVIIYEIEDDRLKRTLDDEIEYLIHNIDVDCIDNNAFFNSLVKSEISAMNKLNILVNLKTYSSVYNGLYRIVLKLSLKYNYFDMAEAVNIVENYLDSWSLIINMSRKGIISNNPIYFDRIVLRIEDLLKAEAQVKEIINNSISVIRN